MKSTEEASAALGKTPRTLAADVLNPGRPKGRLWKTSLRDYDWLKMLNAVCGLAAVLLLLTGGIQLLKQDYNSWVMARDECSFGIDSTWEENVLYWSLKIFVEVILGIYEFDAKMTEPSKCPDTWLEPLYIRVNVDRWANPVNVAVIIVTVLTLVFYNFVLKKMIRRKRKDESVNREDLSSAGGEEETLEEIPRDVEKTGENFHHKSKVEDEKAEEIVQRETAVQDGKDEEIVHRETQVEEEKTEVTFHRGSEVEDEKSEENVHQESEVEEKNETQFRTVHNFFNEWRHDEALAVLQDIQSSNSKIEIWKAKCLVKMNRTEDARKLLLEQLEKDEDNTELLLELGYLSLLTKDLTKSKDFFEKVLVLSPEGCSNWLRAKNGLRSIENHPKTTLIGWEYYALMIIACANVLIEKKWLYFCGMASAQKGDFSQAKTYFDEVIQRGGFRMAWTRRAFCCVALGDFEDALEGFQRLLQEDGTFIRVVYLIERMSKAVDGECPYKVLSISDKDSDEKTKEAFARLVSGAQSDEEKKKVGRAYARLSDYVFKLQYDTLRNEILRYSPN